MSFVSQYQAVIQKLAKLGISASIVPYTGNVPELENLGDDGLVLSVPSLEDSLGLLSLPLFKGFINDLLKGDSANAVVLSRQDGVQEIYAYYITESDFGTPLDANDLCVWVGETPSDFVLDDTSDLCQSAWVNGWDDITCDSPSPARLAMLEYLVTAKLVKLDQYTAKQP